MRRRRRLGAAHVDDLRARKALHHLAHQRMRGDAALPLGLLRAVAGLAQRRRASRLATSATIQRSPVHSPSLRTASARSRARRPRPARIRSGPARSAPAGRRVRAHAPAGRRALRARARRRPRSARAAARPASARRARASGAERWRAPGRAPLERRRAAAARRRGAAARRRDARRSPAALGELAQRVLRPRHIGGIGEAHQRHFRRGERAGRILHVFDALEQDLPGAGQLRRAPACRRFRAPRRRSTSLIAGSSAPSGAIFSARDEMAEFGELDQHLRRDRRRRGAAAPSARAPARSRRAWPGRTDR